MSLKNMNVVALAGGVGGAKLADGLARQLPPEQLTIIVNTGDDFEHLGLWVSPDMDTVCYTLAGLANQETGWGRSGESWQTIENVARLGGPDWFRLGDQDLATHLERTRRLREGHTLTQITRHFCSAWGIRPTVLPMSDVPAPTMVLSDEGELGFQEYFVQRRCAPRVQGFRFEGAPSASLPVIQALDAADLIILCPSNPWVSIDPIRKVAGIQMHLERLPVIAVSPIIDGQAVKGPAAKMYNEMGIEPSVAAVAEHYAPWLDGLVIDSADKKQAKKLQDQGLQVLVTETWMKSLEDRDRLALAVLAFHEKLSDE